MRSLNSTPVWFATAGLYAIVFASLLLPGLGAYIAGAAFVLWLIFLGTRDRWLQAPVLSFVIGGGGLLFLVAGSVGLRGTAVGLVSVRSSACPYGCWSKKLAAESGCVARPPGGCDDPSATGLG